MTPLYAGVVDAHMCEDCGLEPKAGRSYRCEGCRRAHRTRMQTRAQAERRAARSLAQRSDDVNRKTLSTLSNVEQWLTRLSRDLNLRTKHGIKSVSVTEAKSWVVALEGLLDA